MRLCRFDDNRLGVVDEDKVMDVTEVLHGLPPPGLADPFFAALGTLRPRIEALARDAAPLPLSAVRLGSPVLRPGKIVAAPVNYLAHLEEATRSAEIHHGVLINEIRRAGVFLKAPSSLIGPCDAVRQRFLDRRTDHEVELAVVIGRTARSLSPGEALSHVAGYCIGLDITLRGPEERSFRKSIDTYTVLGPWLVTADEFGAPTDVGLKLDVGGEPRQSANTRDLILSVADLIAFASSFYTLHPGDVILTGTPEGVGPIRPGDVMNASIERIGAMSVRVEAA
ncbi:MAG TPA: fumarylacetoacetate hydrolase family protein [Caulobacteraceae bacterium]|jgi:2-keto-4-pentenoate hydratase/2-oxohepta-3-ene-1,7-dioic acid hydratase in catechol pathway|nr:fumarylacetoacetate hydrolase family protein [Caulobacteraceae bacterium]